MPRDVFLRGAVILTAAGLLVKLVGSVNRILLSRFLGGEGIGLYQMAYPIYLLLSSVSSAGIPVAISIVIAGRLARGDGRGARRAFKISFLLMLVSGAVFSLLLYWGAGWLIEQRVVRDARAYYALIALTPAVFFCTLLASLRGFFQGFQEMLPTAASQVAEQLLRVASMLALAFYLLPYGLEYGAAGATFGALPGTLGGLLVLIFFYWRHRRKQQADAGYAGGDEVKTWPLVKQLVRLSLPISAANIMAPLGSSIDALIVPARLEAAGFGVSEATTLFGYLTGMALPLVIMATIPTASLALSLVPAVSEASALNDAPALYGKLKTAARLAGVITMPAFCGLLVLAGPISVLLYNAPAAAGAVRIMSVGIVFLGLHQVTTAMLQGIGRPGLPMINMLAGAVVKTALAFWLTALPAWGMEGAAWACVLEFFLAVVLNCLCLYKYTGFCLDFYALGKVGALSALMAGGAWGGYCLFAGMLGGNNIATLLACGLGGVIYIALLPLSGCLRRREVAGIPVVGEKIARLFKMSGDE